jgi:hypothetical protein
MLMLLHRATSSYRSSNISRFNYNTLSSHTTTSSSSLCRVPTALLSYRLTMLSESSAYSKHNCHNGSPHQQAADWLSITVNRSATPGTSRRWNGCLITSILGARRFVDACKPTTQQQLPIRIVESIWVCKGILVGGRLRYVHMW